MELQVNTVKHNIISGRLSDELKFGFKINSDGTVWRAENVHIAWIAIRPLHITDREFSGA